ncbi:MAG TPA: aminoglycoside 6-adenylyltransferase [Candidatus Dormibacteraeota bacterium]|nr:aminoglycoside 6-adenylyltransferase [Candidatus Dormibacteraeota bacterium]
MPGRTAILIVNGYDRIGLWGHRFDPSEAAAYPWIELCLREVARRSKDSDHEVLVWDNSHLDAQREVARRFGARVLPSDDELDVARREGEEATRRLERLHMQALERLLQATDDNFEYVITLDTDAFPVKDGWIEHMKSLLGNASLTGIWRDEMAGVLEPYVHPSCMCIRRDRLLRMQSPFSFEGVQDVGQRITREVLISGERIAPLRRSNARNFHFLVGGIYGDLVYHHSAGSRRPVFRMTVGEDTDERVFKRLREALFEDTDHVVKVLRGESDDDLGLGGELVRPMIRVNWTGMGPRDVAWLDGLPSDLSSHARIMRRMVWTAEHDPRIRAVQVQGSLARGEADALSDLDMAVAVAEDAWPAIALEVPSILRQLGGVLDESQELTAGPDRPRQMHVWALFQDGVQLDLLVVPAAGPLDAGPDGRTLYDPDGLVRRTDDQRRMAPPDVVAGWSFIAWHSLAEAIKYLSRGKLAAAAEWLSPARQATLSSWAVAHGVEYAGFANEVAAKVGVSCPWPDALEKAYPVLEATSLLSAIQAVADIQDRCDGLLERQLGVPRRPLRTWVRSRLEILQSTLEHPDSQPETRSRPGRRPAAPRRRTSPRAGRPPR